MHVRESGDLAQLKRAVVQQHEGLAKAVEALLAAIEGKTDPCMCTVGCQTDAELSESCDGSVIRSCLASPRRLEDEPLTARTRRLRSTLALRRRSWDTEVLFAGSAAEFPPCSQPQLVYLVVTRSTFYKVLPSGQVSEELCSGSILSVEYFRDTGFVLLHTEEVEAEKLLCLHGDTKSASALRLLDVVSDHFIEIAVLASDSMNAHLTDEVTAYLEAREEEQQAILSDSSCRHVNVRDDLVEPYTYFSYSSDDDDDGESEIVDAEIDDGVEAVRHEAQRLVSQLRIEGTQFSDEIASNNNNSADNTTSFEKAPGLEPPTSPPIPPTAAHPTRRKFPSLQLRNVFRFGRGKREKTVNNDNK